MDLFQNINWRKALKTSGLIIVLLIVLLVGQSFLSSFLGGTTNPLNLTKSKSSNLYGGGFMADSMEAIDGDFAPMAGLSARNVAGSNIYNESEFSPGEDSEDFEVIDYNGTVETRSLEDDCRTISELKPLDYVIFESSNESDTSCRYSFKVKKDRATEILTIVEGLDPKELRENTRTIKKLVEDYTSETEILLNKKEAIEKTLSDALLSYDEISRIATQSRDAGSLATIIDSKVRMIERLTKERISIATQLDRINRSKANELDRLEFVYFNLYIYENKFINVDNVKDSWKRAIKDFVNSVNEIAQGLSIKLILILLLIIEYVLYLVIFVFTLKYVWKMVKNIWNR